MLVPADDCFATDKLKKLDENFKRWIIAVYHSINLRKLANDACGHIGVFSCNAFIVELVGYERIVQFSVP